MKDRFILACQEYFVKQRATAKQRGEAVKGHRRILRETLPAEAIAPEFKAMAQQVANIAGRERVRIGALNVAEWGQFLRSLEISRGLA